MNDAPNIFDPAEFVLALVLSAVALGIVAGFIYGIYFLLTLPLRRNERVRLFLDLLELGLKDGRAPEAAIVDAASSRDPALGTRFHEFAAQLRNGTPFVRALTVVPHFLPPQIIAMLQAGDRVGDLCRVLPACRQRLNDGVSQVRGAVNYLLILLFVVTPAALAVPVFINVMILPKFREIFADMLAGAQLPAFTRLVFAESPLMSALQITLILLLWLLLLAYVGGPRFTALLRRLLPGVADRIHFLLPWRRKRLQRDFSTMLAVLLDADVPETDAVAIAADATANVVVRRRAEKIRSRLAAGEALPEAIRAVDDSGELHWRLANALQRGRGFLRALAGWHEALDARAFQLEQSTAQLATTFVVLLNGCIVAGIVIGMFLALIEVLNQATLW